MLFTVWVPPAARFNVTFGPDGKQETVMGKFVPDGNGIGDKFFTVLVTASEPVRLGAQGRTDMSSINDPVQATGMVPRRFPDRSVRASLRVPTTLAKK
jgi:hypothetical protein